MGIADVLNQSSRKGRPTKSELDMADPVKKKKSGAAWGSFFEKQIQKTCDIYMELKIAYIQRFAVPTLFVPPRNGKPGFLTYKEKTGFDFVGAIIKSRQSIFIEAKTTEHGTIEVFQEKSGIKTHQLNEMLWLESVGFDTYFFWQIRGADQVVYKLRPSKIIEMIGKTKALTITICDENRIPRMILTKYRGESIYDFLGALE